MINLDSLFQQTQDASRLLSALTERQVRELLDTLTFLLNSQIEEILIANQRDLSKMDVSDSRYDRLLLTEDRIKGIIKEIKQVQELPSPIGQILEDKVLPNGLHLQKLRVPLGVLGIIYESRPNVTIDVCTLAFKSGNALILKGGTDAHETNTALVNLIHQALIHHQLPTACVCLLPPSREAVHALLQARKWVDVIIPRGSQGLIDFVRSNSLVPVIETGAGIVHTYIDKSADLDKARMIVVNSKTRRPSVCNSLDCLIIHHDRLADLGKLIQPLLEAGVEIFADTAAFQALHSLGNPSIKLADSEHFGTEFLSLKMAIKTVVTIDEAIAHIHQYSSKHSEAIVAEDQETLQHFLRQVDAAAVYANASTAFTDGNQFGMGAEIGISTQKLHARGPMALPELTSYKWIIRGNGQIR
ncbi:glutamate-5-semialdehyde dehydrogenase [Mongoliitalea daihaiensis]|uniref:glutamate-5-semialdehyde dehydrogenase n=1 Tax=Mongoliitalea daihaiensis TaxID=2782006 RepID=UPI001F3C37E0|nr:glutamate-5-semialdehyde dehydrogenase [Mongoliitalea daihaiensis]UJP63560.1 glutamate-5-semialdehyde dehydrogenase [Mongoliitalea daihaiensis]